MSFIKHFITITKHRHKVIEHCFMAGIGFQGLFHDLSKYTPQEFITGIKYYRGYKSPNDVEREMNGYSKAWMHHQGRNKHHFEYWRDYNPKTHTIEPVAMPVKYIKEMFCDRVAASKIYMGKDYTKTHPLEYFNRGKIRLLAHEDTVRILEEWLMVLAEKGEKEAFSYIRNYK